eukprot:5156292-Pleurochrysis_carterae.AAC.2
MITYPAHLATKVQEELQHPSYKNVNVPSLPLTVKAFDELWRHACRNSIIRRQDPPLRRSRGGHRVDAMLVDTASDIDDDESAAEGNDMTEDDATLFAMFKASGLAASLQGEILCHGAQPHVDKFRTLFCSVTNYLRGDAEEPSKLAPRVAE